MKKSTNEMLQVIPKELQNEAQEEENIESEFYMISSSEPREAEKQAEKHFQGLCLPVEEGDQFANGTPQFNKP